MTAAYPGTPPDPVSTPLPPAPDDARAALGPLSASGVALLESGRTDEGLNTLIRAVAAGEPGADDLLARAYLESGDWNAAVDFLGRLVDSGRVEYAGRLGAALNEIGDYARAESAFRLAMENGDLAASNDLAILLARTGRSDEAVPMLQWGADSGDPQAAANLVELLRESGDLRSAMIVAERYVDERRPDTLVALAEMRALDGRVDEAEALYRRAIALRALRGHGAYAAFLLTVRGDAAAAGRELWDAAARREPGSAFAFGQFLVDDGRPDEARTYLAMAAAEGDDDAARLLAELNGEDPDDEL